MSEIKLDFGMSYEGSKLWLPVGRISLKDGSTVRISMKPGSDGGVVIHVPQKAIDNGACEIIE